VGIPHIARNPRVLLATNPWYAAQFFLHSGFEGFLVLGTVFLVVTGGEALYADLGHFGRRPIRFGWIFIVLPGLLLNYFGQGAFLLSNPAGTEHPFYRMAPSWALLPLVGLATLAAVIASQAIITGAFSLTLQAIQLGYCPRLTIRHTSAETIGQIYLPFINWLLMIATVAVILGFGTSSRLAAAYGVAITMTMVITTLLFFFVMHGRWSWSLPAALLICGGFLVVDMAYFGANLPKILHGGWFPLLVGAIGLTLMTTWRRGRGILASRMRERFMSLELYLAQTLGERPIRVPGTAVFMSGNPYGTPPALRHNVTHNHVLHERVVVLCVETVELPHVSRNQPPLIDEVGEGIWTIVVKYGFMDEPNVPLALKDIRLPGLDLSKGDFTYFLGRETLFATGHPGMAVWRERLFIWMSRNAQTATNFFKLPPERVMEIGTQMEI
jgi:KUP system potassium uptake protein